MGTTYDILRPIFNVCTENIFLLTLTKCMLYVNAVYVSAYIEPIWFRFETLIAVTYTQTKHTLYDHSHALAFKFDFLLPQHNTDRTHILLKRICGAKLIARKKKHHHNGLKWPLAYEWICIFNRNTLPPDIQVST